MLTRQLWGHGLFVRFVLGAALSGLGTWFNTVAIAVLSYRLTGQASTVAIALTAAVLPRVVLAPIGGVLADRFERRGLLVGLDLASAVVALTPLLVTQRGALPLLYAAVFVLQAASCLYRPAQGAYLAHLVPDDQLEAANAAHSMLQDSSLFTGPLLAAMVLGVAGPGAGFLLNGASFLVSALLLLTLPTAHPGAQKGTSISQLLGGYVSIARRYPAIAALCLCALASVVPIYFFQATIVAYAAALGQPSTFVGVLYAAAGAGGILGGLAMGQWQRHLSPRAVVALYGLEIPLLGSLALVHAPILALVLLTASVASSMVGDLIFSVRVQRYVPTEERGRAFGLVFWCMAVGQMAGAMLGTMVPPALAVPVLLWVSVGVLPITALGLAQFVRSHQVPTAPGLAVAA